MALVLAKNRKALFDHTLLEKYTAGIVLKGFEVKALREGNINFESSFIKIFGGAPYLVNAYIGAYSKQGKTFDEFNARRDRKLLLNAGEINKISSELAQKGRTAIPTTVILDHNLIKLEFALVKGKKEYEKKQTAKDAQVKKDLERESKEIRKLVF